MSDMSQERIQHDNSIIFCRFRICCVSMSHVNVSSLCQRSHVSVQHSLFNFFTNLYSPLDLSPLRLEIGLRWSFGSLSLDLIIVFSTISFNVLDIWQLSNLLKPRVALFFSFPYGGNLSFLHLTPRDCILPSNTFPQ